MVSERRQTKIYRKCKQICEWGQGRRNLLGVIAILMILSQVIISPVYTYTKICQSVQFKYVQLILCQLDCRAILKNPLMSIPHLRGSCPGHSQAGQVERRVICATAGPPFPALHCHLLAGRGKACECRTDCLKQRLPQPEAMRALLLRMERNGGSRG